MALEKLQLIPPCFRLLTSGRVGVQVKLICYASSSPWNNVHNRADPIALP
jgi:hypothetical protein